MPRLVALLLAAAATAASAESDENNFTAASADEGRVKQFAAQSYDWLADRAPAAKAFAAQAAAQHGPGLQSSSFREHCFWQRFRTNLYAPLPSNSL